MTPSTPYLIRGLYEWILDNDMTPYLLVGVSEVDVHFPQELINDNKIILNITWIDIVIKPNSVGSSSNKIYTLI